MAELTVPSLDFSAIGQLPQVYQQAQADQLRKQTLASLGQGPLDAQSLKSAGLKIGDMSLVNLGVQADNTQYSRGRDTTNDAFRNTEAERSQRNADRSFGLQSRSADLAAKKADQERYTVVKKTGADGITEELHRFNPSTGALEPIGQPSAPVNPAMNPKSPLNAALAKSDADRITTMAENSTAAEGALSTLDNIEGLRKKAYTGPVFGRVASYLGVPANQALDAANNELSLDIAQKMKGALSDKDIGFVKSQTSGSATTDEAAGTITGAMRAAFERTKQRGGFYRTWAEQNGTINGADAAWKRFIDENPITVEDKTSLSGRRYNPDYNKDYSPYLGKYGQPAPQSGRPPGAVNVQKTTGPTGPTTQIPPAAIEALRGNPSLKADFEAKYGAGMAGAVLR